MVGGSGDQVRDTDAAEDAQASAAGGSFTGEGNDGNARPEGVAGCGDAVIGEGVQGDVDSTVKRQIFLARAVADEFDAGRIDIQPCATCRCWRNESTIATKFGVRDGSKDFTPRRTIGSLSLAGPAKRAEPDRAANAFIAQQHVREQVVKHTRDRADARIVRNSMAWAGRADRDSLSVKR